MGPAMIDGVNSVPIEVCDHCINSILWYVKSRFLWNGGRMAVLFCSYPCSCVCVRVCVCVWGYLCEFLPV